MPNSDAPQSLRNDLEKIEWWAHAQKLGRSPAIPGGAMTWPADGSLRRGAKLKD